ncbi:MAG: M23 family metallopeptidase [Muribaculaceae bacterium]|nr:M23 family metallopeptidase [Muribaculaceae bacterium]
MKRRPKIFRFSLEDETRLQTLADHSFSGPALVCIIAGVALLLMTAGALLMAFTPLRSLIPGYFRESQREATQEAIMKVDSLQAAYNRNAAYLTNIRSVLDTERNPSDSLTFSRTSIAFAADSLLPRSVEEARFSAMMQEREKFNIEVIASMAADGMLMYPVCDEGVASKDSRDSFTVKISVPYNASLMAIADGVVIAAYYEPAIRAYVLLTQHDNGFVSRISGIGTPMVGQGDKVNGGEIISSSPTPKSGKPSVIDISLWHNGTPVKPYEYIIGHRYRIPPSSEGIRSPRNNRHSLSSGPDTVQSEISHINP